MWNKGSFSLLETLLSCGWQEKPMVIQWEPLILERQKKKKKKLGVTRRTPADSQENNILEDISSQPSLKAYAIKSSKQSQSHRWWNERPVIFCCCRRTNIWVHTSAVNQNYSSLAASELEVLCNARMFLCKVAAFITFITRPSFSFFLIFFL